jgi:hypothetical protein
MNDLFYYKGCDHNNRERDCQEFNDASHLSSRTHVRDLIDQGSRISPYGRNDNSRYLGLLSTATWLIRLSLNQTLLFRVLDRP